jgi:hypothetical protein
MCRCNTAPADARAEIVEGILLANNGGGAAGAMRLFAVFFFLDFQDYLLDLQKGPWEVVLPEAQVSERKPLLSGAHQLDSLRHCFTESDRSPATHNSRAGANVRESLGQAHFPSMYRPWNIKCSSKRTHSIVMNKLGKRREKGRTSKEKKKRKALYSFKDY